MNHIQITKYFQFQNKLYCNAKTEELTTIPSDVQHAIILNNKLPTGKFHVLEQTPSV